MIYYCLGVYDGAMSWAPPPPRKSFSAVFIGKKGHVRNQKPVHMFAVQMQPDRVFVIRLSAVNGKLLMLKKRRLPSCCGERD